MGKQTFKILKTDKYLQAGHFQMPRKSTKHIKSSGLFFVENILCDM